jgi:hypothetical protein
MRYSAVAVRAVSIELPQLQAYFQTRLQSLLTGHRSGRVKVKLPALAPLIVPAKIAIAAELIVR